MASITLERLNEIDQGTKDIVFGYLRRIRASSDSITQLYNIPPLISSLCLLFYHFGQFFDEAPACLEMSGNNNNTVTKILNSGVHNSIYSKEWIEANQNKIVELTVKFNQHGAGACIAYGVVNSEHSLSIESTFYNIKGAFCIWNSGYAYRNGKCVSSSAMKTRTGDVVKMTLDFAKRQIKLIKNDGECEWVILKDIHKNNEKAKYKFAFTLWNKGDSITIVSCRTYNASPM